MQTIEEIINGILDKVENKDESRERVKTAIKNQYQRYLTYEEKDNVYFTEDITRVVSGVDDYIPICSTMFYRRRSIEALNDVADLYEKLFGEKIS